MKRQLTFTCGGLLAAFLPSAVLASETADWIRPMSDISAGDTAWVMVSALLVLFMTMPGLALFYAGMVRKKNVLANPRIEFFDFDFVRSGALVLISGVEMACTSARHQTDQFTHD